MIDLNINATTTIMVAGKEKEVKYLAEESFAILLSKALDTAMSSENAELHLKAISQLNKNGKLDITPDELIAIRAFVMQLSTVISYAGLVAIDAKWKLQLLDLLV